MPKTKKMAHLAAIAVILAGTSFGFSRAFVSRLALINIAYGEDNEVEEGDDRENSEDSDSEKNKVSDDEEENDEREEADEQEVKKNKNNFSGESRKAEEGDDEDENDDEDEAGEDDFDDDREDDVNEAPEKIQKLNRKVAKVEIKISAAGAAGIDTAAFTASLDEIKALLVSAQGKLDGGDDAGAKIILESAKDKLEILKESMEEIFDEDDDDDSEIGKEYKNSVAEFVHTLQAVADREGGIGSEVRIVAQAQNDSKDKVNNLINEINQRGGFVEFMLGPDYHDLNDIKNEIAANQNRIAVLTEVMGQIVDPAAKSVLLEQIQLIQKQNSNLQSFVDTNMNKVSLFGWFLRMFA